MDNIKNDFYYVKRLLRSIEITSRYLKNKSIDACINDGFLCDAIENRFTKIAEDAAKLSKDYKKRITLIPWDGIASIRNRVCHDYDVVDFAILYKTIKVNFPNFRNILLDNDNVHRMNLYPDAFERVSNKNKTIEMRLNDEKRQKLNIGDLIVFTNTKTKEEAVVEITNLKTFKSFDDLYLHYDKKFLGYKDDEKASPNDMLNYYSQNQTDVYGVIAIEIRFY